jgi:hypothetical protein
MLTHALRLLVAASLLLGTGLRAQVFEVGEDGVMREAPGLNGRQAPKDAAMPAEPQGATPVLHPRPGSREPGGWVVQLGADPDRAELEAEWRRLREQHADLLAPHAASWSTAVVGGRRHARLSVTGFQDRRAAQRLCGELQARGTNCFVRRAAPAVMATQD